MHSQRDCAGANGKEGNRMTTAEMLFGSGDLAPSNAAWGRVLGIARQTVGEKIRNPARRP